MIIQMTFDRFQSILSRICKMDTSFDPKGWTEGNPFWGHSDVVTLLALSQFGGMVAGLVLKNTKFAKLQFHYWNVISISEDVSRDFTRSQFGEEYPEGMVIHEVDPAWLHAKQSIAWRFKMLKAYFEVESVKDWR